MELTSSPPSGRLESTAHWQRMSSTLRESGLTSKPQRTPWAWKPEGPLETTSSQMGPEDPAVSPGPEAPSSQLQGFWPGEGRASQIREECPEKHPKRGRKDKLALCSPFPPHDKVSKNRPSSPTQKTTLNAMPAQPPAGYALLFGSKKPGWDSLILSFIHSFIHCTGVLFLRHRAGKTPVDR